MPEKKITVRLTPEQARLVFQNADGWMDAGSCKEGLEPDEMEALEALTDQILAGLKRAGLTLAGAPKSTD